MEKENLWNNSRRNKLETHKSMPKFKGKYTYFLTYRIYNQYDDV